MIHAMVIHWCKFELHWRYIEKSRSLCNAAQWGNNQGSQTLSSYDLSRRIVSPLRFREETDLKQL